MSSSARARLGVVAACAVVAGAVAWIHNSTAQHGVIRPGSTAFSVEDDGVRRLTYKTDKMTLTARRGGAGDRFTVEVQYRDGTPAHRCQSSQDLAGMLPRLVEVTARRELKPEQVVAEFPVQVGVLELEDEVRGEPIAPFTVRARADRSAIALAYQDTSFEAAIDPAMFSRLEQGCAALAMK